jgi:hypothetical protein
MKWFKRLIESIDEFHFFMGKQEVSASCFFDFDQDQMIKVS